MIDPVLRPPDDRIPKAMHEYRVRWEKFAQEYPLQFRQIVVTDIVHIGPIQLANHRRFDDGKSILIHHSPLVIAGRLQCPSVAKSMQGRRRDSP